MGTKRLLKEDVIPRYNLNSCASIASTSNGVHIIFTDDIQDEPRSDLSSDGIQEDTLRTIKSIHIDPEDVNKCTQTLVQTASKTCTKSCQVGRPTKDVKKIMLEQNEYRCNNAAGSFLGTLGK